MSYDINLKHLEYFIKVARLGSINKAALNELGYLLSGKFHNLSVF